MNNKKRNRFIFRVITLSLLAVATIFTIYTGFAKEKYDVLQVGDDAPDFALVDLDGKEHQLSTYKGQGVFLNFWGSWCAPCKKEMPAMGRQYEVYKNDGVQILAVNIAEPDFKVRAFAGQYGMVFPTLIDQTKSVMQAYNVKPLPTTFLINPEGKIVRIITGEMSESDIKGYMEEIKPD
ncbi:thiol-disulfide oxidoreductase ResA [Sporosarcina oncorhynchi]|uniref:Thiol-disulfide oxidoreductase ResA n=1 Tax=Sporosarcina oncorhynchi TaxID=3056444 RepID=A0ABZ0L2U3_9BACL|nr:thiol-disulfide oxidoreductase ResA [Sporosarcina sp. T2O-4]WOV86507.1 thiol-disulfide oxidoreductase ResA [Sporosarcina sp. T2O-4]